jgi:ABC-type Co2+ transport system permease subunit
MKAFVAGFIGVMVPALAVALEFMAAGYGKGFLALIGLYSAVAAAEALMTAAIVGFLVRTKPAVLASAFAGDRTNGAQP